MTLSMRTANARGSLERVYARISSAGGATPGAGGHLIRPLLCVAGARASGVPAGDAFWSAAAALQLAHEASLLHDDVIDQATVRRSAPTVVAKRGVGAALVEGDHLLTTGYRLAAETGSIGFVNAFAHAVERTVAGEKLQGRSTGVVLDEPRYRQIVGQKSGELLGCALATGALVAGAGTHLTDRAGALYTLGRRMGTLYQMLDDLLDYCPDAGTGKPPLADFRQRRWTWPLLEMPGVSLGGDADALPALCVTPDAYGTTPLRRCLLRLEHEADVVRAAIAVIMPDDEIANALVMDWLGRAAEAVQLTERAQHDRELHLVLSSRVPEPAALTAYFRQNSRSFSFAARLFPLEVRRSIELLYAFCRITDDLADDESVPVAQRMARLDSWHALARRAYDGEATGITLLDDVMTRAAAASVPFAYVDALIDGMRMDLRGENYATLGELRVYSYRVAGVVGQWVTRLCGVHDEDVLDSAAALGHAMQLTNILRDVGEDLDVGRVYLPARILEAFGVSVEQLRSARHGAALPDGYRPMLEQLMEQAAADYQRALAAAASLPPFFRRPVVVAAHVYQGIHDSIRANDHDNLTRRAHTALTTKFRLAATALSPVITPGARTSSVLQRARSSAGAAARLFLVIAFGLMVAAAALAAQPVEGAEQHHERLTADITAVPDNMSLRLDMVRTAFLLAVDDEALIEDGRGQLSVIRERAPSFARAHAPVLLAYEGAFTALEAKHGSWPLARFRAVRAALRQLDEAVQSAPANAEVRYLRAVNTHYLPGLFGRGESARDDVAELVRLLTDGSATRPAGGRVLPASLRPAVAGFLIDSGRLADPDEAAVRALLERAGRSVPQ